MLDFHTNHVAVPKDPKTEADLHDDGAAMKTMRPSPKTYSYDEAYVAAREAFGGDDLAASTWVTKYALRDLNGQIIERSPADMHQRLARAFAAIEARYPNSMSEDEIFALLADWTVVPQGSPMSGVGNPYKFQSVSNCFVVPSPEDSYGGILLVDQLQAQIMKRRGGVGFDVSTIRPKGLPTANAAHTTDGIGIFMERFSRTCREVAQGGRRGALMLTCDVHHPEILTFIRIKNDLTRCKACGHGERMKVTGANVSVRLTDEFLNAVERGEKYQQRWPVDRSDVPSIENWVDARAIWEEITQNARDSAEPGLLFWDNILRESPADCYADVGYQTTSTNPCSEIPLSPWDSCRLMAINLSNFVSDPFTDNADFDWRRLSEVAKRAQRLMDDLVDIEIEHVDRILAKIDRDHESEDVKRVERDLWERIRETGVNGRRTGLGVTAVGDTVAMMGMKYGSDQSIDFVERMYRALAVAAYEASVDMASERGCFPAYAFRKEAGHPFIERILDAAPPELRVKYERHGRRNISCLTTAPTGSVSILTQTSSGIEPVFRAMYTRRKKINPSDEGTRVDDVDAHGDRWQHFTVKEHGFKRWQDVTGKTDEDFAESPYAGAQAEEIDWLQRVRLQAAAGRWIDHAISSCLVAGESLVWTDKGLLDIEELAGHAERGQFAPVDMQVSSINAAGTPAQISQGFNNGLARVLRISFPNGFEISCTPNHKLVVLDENYTQVWKEAASLRPGDVVVGRKGINLWNDGSKCLTRLVGTPFQYEHRTNAKDVRIPKDMTPALARLLGYMCSDGFWSENSIGLSQQRNDAAEDFAGLVGDLFDLEVSEKKDERGDNLFQYVANSREAAAFMQWIGIRHHDDLVVPLAIRRSGRQCVKEFIRGLTINGFVSRDSLGITTSICLPFLRQVQQLLLNLGIEAGIDQCAEEDLRMLPDGKEYRCKDAWVLRISHSEEAERFVRLVGSVEDSEDKFHRASRPKFHRASRPKLCGEVPDHGLRERFRDLHLGHVRSNRLYEIFHSLTCADKRGRWLNRESLLEMADVGLDVPPILLDPTYVFRPIKTIEDGGIRQTFDVEVPDGHAYVANGIISHNTINLPKDVSTEVVRDIYTTAWKMGVKGITVYRDTARDGVLIEKKSEFVQHSAPKRPEVLPCDIHRTRVKIVEDQYEDWIFFVGLYDGKPFEIFGGTTENIELPRKVERGWIVKRAFKTGGKYDLCYGESDDPFKIKDIVRQFDNPERGWATRMVSLSLRHGAPIQYVVEQLQRDRASDMFDFARTMARVLKRYIPDGSTASHNLCASCGAEDSLRYQEGCLLCVSCGSSKCG
jgi:ribonucleoside-diphosphate reductase alpha chain